jgi:His-Xaa-Ser system radical SAM maturase HxsC
MLALQGYASRCQGLDGSASSTVIRARASGGPPADPATDFALVREPDELERAKEGGFTGALIIANDQKHAELVAASFPRAVHLPAQFGYLKDGDILGVHADSRRCRTLYRRASKHNSFLVTDRCNHYCLMCSQPPKDVDDRWILREIRAALPLIDKGTTSLGFTGGEPLLDWRDFIALLADCRGLLPDTAIHVLSNGRAFARGEVVSAWAQVKHPSLCVGIPIYAAVDHVHDHVVQARGAFDETVLGILKLKDKAQRVEIRVVLHALTAPRIAETCRWIARNIPFVDHVALMGLENTGFAIANADQLWIDPVDFQHELAEAVDLLSAARVRVSVYNLPRCVLDRSAWPYAMQSISDWKNGYDDGCDRCVEKARCSGFFTSGRPRRSRGVAPILVS